ncbi:hypothetical protein [Jiulongibacter sediminis]|jgi:hypothetical protein|uniref:hypothetical protein n=1 Tax=Jiulongibacter sediminis TaxID=1605367 RepID=UPI0026EC38B3|nr:hypothetical protein [Jiulongibacter sediminis]
MKKIISLTALVVGVMTLAHAQDSNSDNHQITVVVPNIALLDIEPGTAATRNFSSTFEQPTPLEAGEKIDNPDDNTDLWINYSSILPTAVASRKVNVKASALPEGVTIKVTAGAAAAGGAGTKGTSAGEITLSTSDQEIISGIGSVYTGTGISKGHQLTYAFEADDADYADLEAKSTAVTVTYTLVDN